jgi:Bacterial Ig-like domain (group 3)/Bacterial Ig-like domain (group 2)
MSTADRFGRGRRWLQAGRLVLGLAVVATGLATAAAVGAKPASATQAPVSVTFSPTGTVQSFTVPSGVSRLSITVDGASGGSGGGSTQAKAGSAGQGGEVTATVSVSPGQVLTVVAGQFGVSGMSSGGGGGSGGPSNTPVLDLSGGDGGKPDGSFPGGGGGGGGASGVFLGRTVLLVAGGGGGGGGAGGIVNYDGGSGGSNSTATVNPGSKAPGPAGGGGGGGGSQATTFGEFGHNADAVTGGGGGGGGGGGYNGTGGAGGGGQGGGPFSGGGGGGGSGNSYRSSSPVTGGAFAASPLDGPGRVKITYTQQATTTTTVTSSNSPSIYGQLVTFTATVAPSSGSGTPRGVVNFADGFFQATPMTCLQADNHSFTVPLENGVASCTTSIPLSAAGHLVTAFYFGDDDFGDSNGSTPQPVNQASTTTQVSSSVNPVVAGQPVTFTAAVAPVAPGAGTPTGTVGFSDGPTQICPPSALGGDTPEATCVTSALAVGNHSIVATYNGDDNFTGSSSSSAPQEVQPAPLAVTTTSLLAATGGAAYGQTLAATGGTVPYTWSISAKSLPPGLSIDPSSGTISGTPTSVGTFDFTAKVTDSTSPSPQSATQPLSITVNAVAPKITTQPADLTVNAGQTASFVAAASGFPAPNTQWQVSTDSGSTFADIPAATSPTYSFTAGVINNASRYRAVFTNSAGAATTTGAALIVDAPPTITTQPTDQTLTAGQPATFTASASSNPASSVRWQVSTDGGKSFSDITGATSPTYSFVAGLTQKGDRYRAVFTNAVGSATTNAATLTVLPALSSITLAPASTTVAPGMTQVFVATGHYSDGTSKDLSAVVAWASSAPGAATVSPGGALKAISTGTADITAHLGTVSAHATVTVSPLRYISVQPWLHFAQQGAKVAYTANGFFANGAVTPISSHVSWSSTNTRVATISPQGLATTHSRGAAVVIARFGGTPTLSAVLVVG